MRPVPRALLSDCLAHSKPHGHVSFRRGRRGDVSVRQRMQCRSRVDHSVLFPSVRIRARTQQVELKSVRGIWDLTGRTPRLWGPPGLGLKVTTYRLVTCWLRLL